MKYYITQEGREFLDEDIKSMKAFQARLAAAPKKEDGSPDFSHIRHGEGPLRVGRGGAPRLEGVKRHSLKALKTRLVRGVTKRLGMSRREFGQGAAQGEISSRDAQERGEEGNA